MTLFKFEKNVGCSKRMRKSYVFIETSFGYTDLALEELIKIDYVAKCSKLCGMYDIVVEIEAQTVQKLNEANSKVKALQIVKSTTTMLVKSERL